MGEGGNASRRRCDLKAVCTFGLMFLASAAAPRAVAADMSALGPATLAAPLWSQYEFRLGAFAHGVGFLGPGFEQGSVDLNAEFLLPRLPLWQDSFWSFLSPRPQIGGMLNLDGKTSYAFAGVVWTLDLTPNWFFEPMFGGAIHDGELTAPRGSGRLSLGCSPLFHTGASIGYHLSGNWDVMLTWDHISNAGLCGSNPGINDFGVKIGYLF
jgi:lipid A 3-O-deacylase